jgi:hypothetical protein
MMSAGWRVTDRRTVAIAASLVAALSLDLRAGVVVTESAKTTADGKVTSVQVVYSVQGQKMRVHRIRPDDTDRQGLVHVYDAAAGRLVILDRDKQEAEIYDAAKAAAEVEERLPSDRIASDVKPTGRTRNILGVTCEDYTFVIKAPLTDSAHVVRSGTACVAKQAPGVEEYVAFFKAAATVLTAGSITAPKSVVAADRTDTEFYRRIAMLGGMPYAFEMKLEVEGSGLMARMLRGALTWSREMTTTSVTTDALSEADFAIPAGWKTRHR